jgi:DNA-binding PadR family transcriptional regulator
MSLPHALLAALLERPRSGLALARQFDKSFGHFWSASHQQIYRELSRLEADGLIASEAEVDARGRKRTWRALDAGRDELRAWIPRDDPAPSLRDTLMVRLRAEAIVGPTGLEATLRARLKAHEDKLALYQGIEARDFPDPRKDRATAVQHLVLRAGLRHETYWIGFLTDALTVLCDPDLG